MGNRPEEEESPDPSKCPEWGGGSGSRGGGINLTNLWNAVVNFFTPSGSTQPYVVTWNFTLPDATKFNNSGTGTYASGNGSGDPLAEEIDNNLFGASRSRLINVVKYLELNEADQIRSLIYDPLLVTHLNNFIRTNNDAEYGFSVAIPKKQVLIEYLNFIRPQLSALANVGYPAIGSQEWYNMMTSIRPVSWTGVIRFEGFTPAELAANFRIIPEDGAILAIPQASGVNYVGDGILLKNHTPDKYWVKVSQGGLAVIQKDPSQPSGFSVQASIHDQTGYFWKNTAFVLHATNFSFWVGFDRAEVLNPAIINNSPFR